MESFSASFCGLGFDHHHLVRAWNVRQPGDIHAGTKVMKDCDAAALRIYAGSKKPTDTQA